MPDIVDIWVYLNSYDLQEASVILKPFDTAHMTAQRKIYLYIPGRSYRNVCFFKAEPFQAQVLDCVLAQIQFFYTFVYVTLIYN